MLGVMKLLLLAAVLPCVVSSANAGAELTCESEVSALLSGARSLATAYEKGDSIALARLSHPFLIQQAGGRARFVEFVKAAARQQKNEGFRVESIRYGSPSATYYAGSDLVCFLPVETKMTGPSGRFRETGFLIGVRDLGASSSWVFLGSSGLRNDPELLWKAIPSLPRGVTLPPNRIAPVQ